MSAVDLGVERYTGVDVVPELIQGARTRGGPGQEFIVADITKDPLPCADLVLCRDCLVHLTEEQAIAALANIKSSGSAFLLTTTFFSVSENLRGSTGGWRPVNLQRAPFSFPRPDLMIPEREFDVEHPYSDKALGLWALSALP